MSFSRVKPTGWTANLDTLTAAQLNTLDTNMSNAVDSRGGVIVPTSLIEIQGSVGLKINGTGAAAQLQYGSESISRVQTGILWNTGGDVGSSSITVAAGAGSAQTLDRLSDDARLDTITIYIDRVNLGTLPTTRVSATLRKRVISTGVASVVAGPTIDPTSTLAAYEAHHSFQLTSINETLDNEDAIYWLDISGESGANTSTVTVFPCICTLTVVKQDKVP